MSVRFATRQTAQGQRADPQRVGSSQHLRSPGRAVAPIHRLQRKVGNRALNSFLDSSRIQAKLTVSEPDDEYEREADRVADQVMRMADPSAGSPLIFRGSNAIQRKCGCNGEQGDCEKCKATNDSALQRSAVAHEKPQAVPAIVHEVLRSPGRSLDPEVRTFMEPRFNHDFSGVRVHTDQKAADSAKELGARAYAAGRHIVFNESMYSPSTPRGRSLLAHELTHVVQQGAFPGQLARQPQLGTAEIPLDLKNSPALRLMTIEALQKRYDRIMETLAQFNESTHETALLDQQLINISNELARRVALEQGRTFDQRVIDQMKDYLVENAKTERDSCIVCMNKGIRKLLEDPNQRLTPESVDATMELLRQSGRASGAREIWFNDERGRLTRGGGRPHQLRESVSSALLEMVGKDVGWSVFGMSLMDGLHSVLLTVDTHDPAQPRIYWSDQWKSKKGWKEYTREGLDREITRLIQGWWDEQPVGKKHTLVVRLWRLRQ